MASVAVLLATVSVVCADEVFLKTGRSVRGEVVKEDENFVTVKTSGGEIPIPRKMVEKIVRSKAKKRPPEATPEEPPRPAKKRQPAKRKPLRRSSEVFKPENPKPGSAEVATSRKLVGRWKVVTKLSEEKTSSSSLHLRADGTYTQTEKGKPDERGHWEVLKSPSAKKRKIPDDMPKRLRSKTFFALRTFSSGELGAVDVSFDDYYWEKGSVFARGYLTAKEVFEKGIRGGLMKVKVTYTREK